MVTVSVRLSGSKPNEEPLQVTFQTKVPIVLKVRLCSYLLLLLL